MITAAQSIPDDAVRAQIESIFTQVGIADDQCTDVASWQEATMGTLTLLGELEASLGAGAELPAFPSELVGEASSWGPILAAANDRTVAALTDAPPIQASNLWFSASHLAHVQGLADPTLAVDTIVVGSSLAARAVEPAAISSTTGDTVVNLAMIGSVVPVHELIANQAIELAGPSHIVWILSTQPFFNPTCGEGSDARMLAALANQGALESNLWGGQGDIVDVILSSGSNTYGDTQISGAVSNFHGPEWELGATLASTGANPDLRASQLESFTGFYTNPQVCSDLLNDAVSYTHLTLPTIYSV